MDYKQLNTILKDLDAVRHGSTKLPLVEQKSIKEMPEEGSQGDEGEKQEVYKLPFDNLYLRLHIKTDSYGYNERVSGVEFVKVSEKTVMIYETI